MVGALKSVDGYEQYKLYTNIRILLNDYGLSEFIVISIYPPLDLIATDIIYTLR